MDNTDFLQQEHVLKKLVKLEYITIIYNMVEGILCIVTGIISGSPSLEVFGVDSFIESISASVVIWRSKKLLSNRDQKVNPKLELRSRRYVAYGFFLFGSYITFEAIEKIYLQEKPEPILLGMIMAFISLLVMPFMAWKKYQAGKQLDSQAVIADAKQTLICAILSGILFLGLWINYAFGIGWVDPVVSLIIAFYMLREGKELVAKHE